LKVITIFILCFCWNSLFSINNSCIKKIDSVKPYKIITKTQLAHIIDSVLELNHISNKDLDLLNYYASLLKNNTTDSIKIPEFNLTELSFYSATDEKLLFPPTNLDSLPESLTLKLQDNLLSYYHSPCKGAVTSYYGWREGRIHKGIDIDLEKGDKVSVAFDGKVRFAQKQGGFGNVVIVMHPNGLETVYAHLSKIKVKPGDVVLSGQVIGLGGNTGHSTGTHLHFELRYKGHPLNPGAIISFTEHTLQHHSIIIKNTKQSLSAFPSNSYIHTVNKGESWNAIATTYGLKTIDLLTLNGIDKRYYLKVGQKLRVN
jgi:hypothetical protein